MAAKYCIYVTVTDICHGADANISWITHEACLRSSSGTQEGRFTEIVCLCYFL